MESAAFRGARVAGRGPSGLGGGEGGRRGSELVCGGSADVRRSDGVKMHVPSASTGKFYLNPPPSYSRRMS